MDGPRGSLVIALLFLIAGQLAFIASALSGNGGGSFLGFVLSALFVVALLRVVIELFREGAAQRRADEQQEHSAARPASSSNDPLKRRPTQF